MTTYSIALIDKELTLGSKGVDVMTFVDRQDNRARKEYSTRTRSPVRFATKGSRLLVLSLLVLEIAIEGLGEGK
jgi:hypothetical protein